MALKLTKKTAEKILKWSWNIIFLYALFAITFIVIDTNNNPEFHNGRSDCKPLIKLLDNFNKYIAPVWPAFIILVIASYILNYSDHDNKFKALQFIRKLFWNLLFAYPNC